MLYSDSDTVVYSSLHISLHHGLHIFTHKSILQYGTVDDVFPSPRRWSKINKEVASGPSLSPSYSRPDLRGLACMYVLCCTSPTKSQAEDTQIMNFIAPLVEGFPGCGGLYRAPGKQKGDGGATSTTRGRAPPPNQASPSLHRRLLASSMVATWPLGCAAASPALAAVES